MSFVAYNFGNGGCMLSTSGAHLEHFHSLSQFQSLIHYGHHVTPGFGQPSGALIVWPCSVGSGVSLYAYCRIWAETNSSRGTFPIASMTSRVLRSPSAIRAWTILSLSLAKSTDLGHPSNYHR